MKISGNEYGFVVKVDADDTGLIMVIIVNIESILTVSAGKHTVTVFENVQVTECKIKLKDRDLVVLSVQIIRKHYRVGWRHVWNKSYKGKAV